MDAIVIGAGPNGLAAAAELSHSGYSVTIYEANEIVGGSVRSAELTLPGFTHDICAAVLPLGAYSPFLSRLPLDQFGLKFINPPAALAHPFADGTAVLLYRSLDDTGNELGRDGHSYRRLMRPFVENWDQLAEDLLAPPRMPRHPFKLAQFGFYGIRPARSLARSLFKDQRARSLFAGLSAHSFLSLDMYASSAFGLVMSALGHAVGWPIVQGGSQKLSDALKCYLLKRDVKIVTGVRVNSFDELPPAKIIMCDVTPRQLLAMGGRHFPKRFRKKLATYRYGPAAFKVDWALNGPVPWKAQECSEAATVHLGSSFEEILNSEAAPWTGQIAERPFVIVSQPTLFDRTRSPTGQHTLWAYCHVPNGSTVDMTDRIENQIEYFAPGFRDRILAKSTLSPKDLEKHNPNLVGGDINGGALDLRQMFTRPTIQLYSTPAKGIYICSSSTPPGGGVHGMCGYNAVRRALGK